MKLTGEQAVEYILIKNKHFRSKPVGKRKDSFILSLKKKNNAVEPFFQDHPNYLIKVVFKGNGQKEKFQKKSSLNRKLVTGFLHPDNHTVPLQDKALQRDQVGL